MSKRNVIAIFFLIAAALWGCGFVILLIKDYLIHYPYGSAPFCLYILERAVMYLVPAVICLVIGLVIKEKSK